jgi:ABC-type nitrate/sulfonate/bicarbonate transport system ATPase subunit
MGPDVRISIKQKRFSVLPKPLFDGFELDIAPSSVLALVGPSGVGKSTLLRMVAGVDTDFAGSIRVDGREAANSPPAGFVFQDARLLPWLTAAQNVAAVNPKTTPARAGELLGRVGLAGYAEAFPHELSGGMQRRVALARAMAVNARFWLFDEPFVSLDRHLVGELQALFLEMVAAEAPTVILVTHLPEDAARLAHRAVVLAGMPARITADMAFEGDPAQREPEQVSELAAKIADSAGVQP